MSSLVTRVSKSIASTLATFIAVFLPFFAFAGVNHGGGGGSGQEIEFRNVGLGVLDRLETARLDFVQGINAAALKDVIASTPISMNSKLVSPKGKSLRMRVQEGGRGIELNGQAWAKLKLRSRQEIALSAYISVQNSSLQAEAIAKKILAELHVAEKRSLRPELECDGVATSKVRCSEILIVRLEAEIAKSESEVMVLTAISDESDEWIASTKVRSRQALEDLRRGFAANLQGNCGLATYGSSSSRASESALKCRVRVLSEHLKLARELIRKLKQDL